MRGEKRFQQHAIRSHMEFAGNHHEKYFLNQSRIRLNILQIKWKFPKIDSGSRKATEYAQDQRTQIRGPIGNMPPNANQLLCRDDPGPFSLGVVRV
jgi:hypothetical protein